MIRPQINLSKISNLAEGFPNNLDFFQTFYTALFLAIQKCSGILGFQMHLIEYHSHTNYPKTDLLFLVFLIFVVLFFPAHKRCQKILRGFGGGKYQLEQEGGQTLYSVFTCSSLMNIQGKYKVPAQTIISLLFLKVSFKIFIIEK